MNTAVILAGGTGSRFGADRPKQFLTVAGKTIMEHTIEAFSKNDSIDEICIVCHKDWIDYVKGIVFGSEGASDCGYPKVKHVLCGGKERYHSTLAAISVYNDALALRCADATMRGNYDDCNLLIHDCVRPLVSQRIINDCIAALKDYRAVDVAVPTTDTIIELDSEGHIARIPQRVMLRNVQTPQCFRMSLLRDAFDKALKDPDFQPTDDCSVVFRYAPEEPIHVVAGDTKNIKITYPEDLAMAERELSF